MCCRFAAQVVEMGRQLQLMKLEVTQERERTQQLASGTQGSTRELEMENDMYKTRLRQMSALVKRYHQKVGQMEEALATSGRSAAPAADAAPPKPQQKKEKEDDAKPSTSGAAPSGPLAPGGSAMAAPSLHVRASGGQSQTQGQPGANGIRSSVSLSNGHRNIVVDPNSLRGEAQPMIQEVSAGSALLTLCGARLCAVKVVHKASLLTSAAGHLHVTQTHMTRKQKTALPLACN